jgi:hypothetical protein
MAVSAGLNSRQLSDVSLRCRLPGCHRGTTRIWFRLSESEAGSKLKYKKEQNPDPTLVLSMYRWHWRTFFSKR